MFSAVGRYPRFDVRLDTTDPVPQWISREWRSTEWRAKDAVRRAQNAYDCHVFYTHSKCIDRFVQRLDVLVEYPIVYLFY